MNWNMILVRGAVKPGLVVAAGLLIGSIASQIAGALGAGDVTPFSTVASYAPALGGLSGIAMWTAFWIRLFAWERGAATDCDHCGGPVSFTRQGKTDYGRQLSDYRHCWNCGNNSPVE